MFVTVVRVILDSYFLRFGDRNPGIRIFPLPLPFFPLLPFSPPPLPPSPPHFRRGRRSKTGFRKIDGNAFPGFPLKAMSHADIIIFCCVIDLDFVFFLKILGRRLYIFYITRKFTATYRACLGFYTEHGRTNPNLF
jgi:hypothetical protein